MTDFPFTADVVLLNSGETARKGMYVELGLHHEIDGPICPDDRNPFMDLDQGREKGQRFRVTFHLLADDEKSTEQPPAEQTEERPKGGPICKQAAILCNDGSFQHWLRHHLAGSWSLNSEQTAAALRLHCRVDSRSELDHNEWAAREFRLLKERFYASQHGQTLADYQAMQR